MHITLSNRSSIVSLYLVFSTYITWFAFNSINFRMLFSAH